MKICRLGLKKRKHSSISSCLVNSFFSLQIRTSHCLCSFRYLLWFPDSCLQGTRFGLKKWAIGHALGGVEEGRAETKIPRLLKFTSPSLDGTKEGEVVWRRLYKC